MGGPFNDRLLEVTMTAKEHYDSHLGDFYEWMAGDFGLAQNKQISLFEDMKLQPVGSAVAIDLGAGHGIQTAALSTMGYQVKAIDFNRQLLDALERNAALPGVTIIEDNILNVGKYSRPEPELVCCCGDTILHLATEAEVNQLVNDVAHMLAPGGKFVVSFRDYTHELKGNDRFIAVRSDETRILTCFLEYEQDRVLVTDLLHFKAGDIWKQKVSSYYKLRITPPPLISILEAAGFKIMYNLHVNRMVSVVAVK